MEPRIEVISIGTLSRNPFWNETGTVRTPHATTTLIRDGTTNILVDPSVPAELLTHRLDERFGLRPEQIDVVFLTSFRPVHRRGLPLFREAEWLISAAEREAVSGHLNGLLEFGQDGPFVETSYEELSEELALLGRAQVAEDRLTPAVHLFPASGVTPGTTALLIAGARTTVVAGDAIVTREYYEAGRVYERCTDPTAARGSFLEIAEVADVIVPGHGNVFLADRLFE